MTLRDKWPQPVAVEKCCYPPTDLKAWKSVKLEAQGFSPETEYQDVFWSVSDLKGLTEEATLSNSYLPI